MVARIGPSPKIDHVTVCTHVHNACQLSKVQFGPVLQSCLHFSLSNLPRISEKVSHKRGYHARVLKRLSRVDHPQQKAHTSLAAWNEKRPRPFTPNISSKFPSFESIIEG
jgi:hypothetical protein